MKDLFKEFNKDLAIRTLYALLSGVGIILMAIAIVIGRIYIETSHINII